VHGDGLDEIALHATTRAALLDGGKVESVEIRPEEVGLERCALSALRGGTPEENAAWLRDVLAGRGTREHAAAVAINAGALLWLAGRAADHRRGVEQALDILHSGLAHERLTRWAALTQGG
jgi:anthranilate phosphoribosyltransferase